jgi:hypothetical protein
MRARVGSSIAVTAVVLALAAPAVAQQAPTLGAPPAPDVTVQTQTLQTTTGSGGGGGLKTWQEALIFAAGIILIGGIAVAILADSRERARHRHKQRSKQQARAKAKAQKAARRRNR